MLNEEPQVEGKKRRFEVPGLIRAGIDAMRKVVGRKVKRTITPEEREAEQKYAEVEKKLKALKERVKKEGGWGSVQEADNVHYFWYSWHEDFFEKMKKYLPHDIEVWSLFGQYLERIEKRHGFYIFQEFPELRYISDASGSDPIVLKTLWQAYVERGGEFLSTLINLREPLYKDDSNVLPHVKKMLADIDDKYLDIVINNTDLFAGSLQKFSYFIDYLERLEKNQGSFIEEDARIYIEKMSKPPTYREVKRRL